MAVCAVAYWAWNAPAVRGKRIQAVAAVSPKRAGRSTAFPAAHSDCVDRLHFDSQQSLFHGKIKTNFVVGLRALP